MKRYSTFRLLSIILLDVTIRLIKQLLVCVQLEFEQAPAQFLLDEAFPLGCTLPAIKADLFHNVVDVRDNALDDYVRVFVLCLIEQFRQRFLGFIALLDWINLLLGLDNVLGQFQDLFQEFQAGQETLFMSFLNLFQLFSTQ